MKRKLLSGIVSVFALYALNTNAGLNDFDAYDALNKFRHTLHRGINTNPEADDLKQFVFTNGVLNVSKFQEIMNDLAYQIDKDRSKIFFDVIDSVKEKKSNPVTESVLEQISFLTNSDLDRIGNLLSSIGIKINRSEDFANLKLFYYRSLCVFMFNPHLFSHEQEDVNFVRENRKKFFDIVLDIYKSE